MKILPLVVVKHRNTELQILKAMSHEPELRTFNAEPEHSKTGTNSIFGVTLIS